MAGGISKAHQRQGVSNKNRRAQYRNTRMREQNQLRRVLRHIKRNDYVQRASETAILVRMNSLLDNGTLKRIYAECGIPR